MATRWGPCRRPRPRVCARSSKTSGAAVGAELEHRWLDTRPERIGDKIAPLVGAVPGEVVVADSTSANLYKVLHAAMAIAGTASRQRPARRHTPSHRVGADEFSDGPLHRRHGGARPRARAVLVDADDVPSVLDDRLAVLLLTHVNYRSGRMFRMAEIDARRARGRRDHGLGPCPHGWRRAGRPAWRRRRARRRGLRRRLRLQVP